MFEQVCEKIVKLEIYLFAARQNAKCESYVFFKAGPNPFPADTFAKKLNDIKGNAFPPFSKNSGQNQTGRNLNNSYTFLLAKPSVLSAASKDGGTQQSTNVTENATQTATIIRKKAETSIVEETTTHSSTFIRCVQMEGLSSDVNGVIMVSWRPSAKVAYNKLSQRFLKYCRRWGYHPQHPAVSEVLHSLHALYTQGLECSTKNSHRSVLSSI